MPESLARYIWVRTQTKTHTPASRVIPMYPNVHVGRAKSVTVQHSAEGSEDGAGGTRRDGAEGAEESKWTKMGI